MTGRPTGDWQKKVAKLPLADQLREIADAGFRGIQLSRDGHEDHGRQVE